MLASKLVDEPDMPLPFTASSKKVTLTRIQVRILSVICALVTVHGFAGSLGNAPQIEILQNIVCRQHYKAETGKLESWGFDCKIEPIQARLAFIQAWKGTFDIIPGLLLAIPYGKHADRTGRRSVLFLSMLGIFIEAFLVRIICWWPDVFPLTLIYFAPLAQVIGGGIPVYMSMLFATISDSVPAVFRTTAFSFVTSTFMITHILGPSAAAAMMDSRGAWLPYNLAFLCLLVSFLVLLPFPETNNQKRAADFNATPPPDHGRVPLRHGRGMKSWMVYIRDRTLHSNHFLRMNNSRSIGLLLLGFFLESFGKASLMLLIVYVSKRFEWTIAKASYLLALRSMVNLVLLLAVVPAVTYLTVNRFHTSALKTELRLTQLSALLLAVSSFVIGFSNKVPLLVFGVVVGGFGSSYDLTARGILTSLVPQAQLAQVYSTMSVVVTFGILVANPLFAALFKLGMLLGGRWQGLPYHVAGVMTLLSFFAVMLVTLPESEAEEGAISLGNGSSHRSGETVDEGQYHDDPF